MPLRETLARVDADLAAGRIPVARQRLRGLVSSFPYDLTLRRRLADCATDLGHPVDWDDPTTYRAALDGDHEEPPSGPWTLGGTLAALGCLLGALAFLAVWVVGVVALFD
ncbi:DUF6584 family protein [Streptomyces sp. NPDC014779]|uniref:DUF6584 family protein n=1 Tax=unclassified Streptomyces TaxID=2593676 RepID=UPI0036FBE6F8